jgi:DNA polymerase III alpha subunit
VLGVTEVDPARMDLLLERFISKERHEPPDIDIDFEHQRREEVMQYIYNKYGRHRAALAATVITYRRRMAIRGPEGDQTQGHERATQSSDSRERRSHIPVKHVVSPESASAQRASNIGSASRRLRSILSLVG